MHTSIHPAPFSPQAKCESQVARSRQCASMGLVDRGERQGRGDVRSLRLEASHGSARRSRTSVMGRLVPGVASLSLGRF